MNLDCDTKEGKKHIQKQNWILRFIEKNSEGVKCTPTGEKICGFDAYVFKNKILHSIIEIKNRPYINRANREFATLEKLKELGTYLITAEKLDVLKAVSKKHKCKSFVVVNLPNDTPRRVLFFQITDWKGRFVIDFSRKTSQTFYSSNDYKGRIERVNAFIPINNNNFLNIVNY